MNTDANSYLIMHTNKINEYFYKNIIEDIDVDTEIEDGNYLLKTNTSDYIEFSKAYYNFNSTFDKLIFCYTYAFHNDKIEIYTYFSNILNNMIDKESYEYSRYTNDYIEKMIIDIEFNLHKNETQLENMIRIKTHENIIKKLDYQADYSYLLTNILDNSYRHINI